jgi:hypothetical protein
MKKEKEKCKALTREGKPCVYDAVINGLCIRHFSMGNKYNNLEKNNVMWVRSSPKKKLSKENF